MRTDERDSLSKIIQSIDEQEIFLEFAAKSDSIKEAWQIAKIFDAKKMAMEDAIKKYEVTIKEKENELNQITNEINEANILLKEANNELETIKEQLLDMQNKAKFYKNKINQGKTISEAIRHENEVNNMSLDLNNNDLLEISSLLRDFVPLSVVDVHVKNNNIARARVAQRVYSENLYENYKKAASRLIKLKDRIIDLELANSKLEIELRDFVSEDNFKENLLSKINANNLKPISLELESMQDIQLQIEEKNDENITKNKLDTNKENIKGIVADLKNVFQEEIKDKA